MKHLFLALVAGTAAFLFLQSTAYAATPKQKEVIDFYANLPWVNSITISTAHPHSGWTDMARNISLNPWIFKHEGLVEVTLYHETKHAYDIWVLENSSRPFGWISERAAYEFAAQAAVGYEKTLADYYLAKFNERVPPPQDTGQVWIRLSSSHLK